MAADVPAFDAARSVEDVRESFKTRTFAFADAVYVTDAQGRLAGEVPIARLLASAGSVPIAQIADPPIVTIPPDTDQELVAAAAHRSRSAAVPVVDGDGKLLGVVPPSALLAVMRHEHSEDVHRLAGIRYSATEGQAALTGPPWLRVLHRLPWLFAGLLGAMLTAAAMAGFESLLKAHVAVAFFIPAIVYLADAIGTQTEAVVVRGLSRGHLPLRAILASEIATGTIIGAVLGVVSLPLTYWGFGSLPITVAVASAIFVASSVASAIGLILPWALSSQKLDPAFGSGPMATIIQDILSILIYLGIVSLLA